MPVPPLLEGWLAVCGLKREAQIWGARDTGDRSAVGGGRSDLLANGVEAAIMNQRPPGLVSFGLAGALSDDLAVGEVIVGAEVVMGARRWTCEAAALAERFGVTPRVVVASETVIAGPAEKRALAALGDAVDMESQVAARAAHRHGLPIAVLRVISDASGDVLPPAAIAGFREDGGIDIPAIVAALVRDPDQLRTLMQMGRNAGTAFRRLKAVRAALG